MVKKAYDLNYINQTRNQLGYQDEALALPVQKGSQALMGFGLIGALFIKYYHLSIEKNGFLFLKRNPWNLKFVENNYFFIPNEDIQEVVLTKGVGFQKLTLTALDGKKTNYLIPKKLYGVPWLAESLKEANNRYASK